MITRPSSRTRALYRWEEEELTPHPFNVRFERPIALTAWGKWAWYHMHRGRYVPPAPLISVDKTFDQSFCEELPPGLMFARTHRIVMAGSQMNACETLHELVHATGIGPDDNIHDWEFVRAYARALSRVLRYDVKWLLVNAEMRGLL